MKIWRITVGTNNPHSQKAKSEKLINMLLARAADFTVREVIGYWNSQRVVTFEVDIATDSEDYPRTLAEAIGLAFHQDSVMLSQIGTAEFINLTEVLK